jgi:hypothetical protein
VYHSHPVFAATIISRGARVGQLRTFAPSRITTAAPVPYIRTDEFQLCVASLSYLWLEQGESTERRWHFVVSTMRRRADMAQRTLQTILLGVSVIDNGDMRLWRALPLPDRSSLGLIWER